MRENKAKRILKSGGAILAVTLNFVHAGLAEFLGRLGYDAIVLDAEHGPAVDNHIEEFARACDLAGVTSILRLPFNSASDALMQRYLDIGIQGYHIPQIQSAADARAVIDAVKFRPLGKRGQGTFRATDYGVSLGSWTAYAEKANAETLIKVSIEDAEGLAALPELARMPEIDVISFGRTDLSNSMGFTGQPNHPKVLEAVAQAMAAVKAAGKAPGFTTATADDIKDGYERGGRYLTTSITRVIQSGSVAYLGALKATR